MSLLVAIFYYIGVPTLIFLGARWFFRRADTATNKRLVVAISMAIALGYAWWAVGEKMWLDHQVRELCAKDGGVKVYETVKLPANQFNQYGQINFYRPIDGENALGPEYLFKRKTHYFKRGNPDLFQIYTQVIRRADNKLLGESRVYARRGGGLPGPWHEAGYICPELSVKADVLRQVFASNKRVSP